MSSDNNEPLSDQTTANNDSTVNDLPQSDPVAHDVINNSEQELSESKSSASDKVRSGPGDWQKSLQKNMREAELDRKKKEADAAKNDSNPIRAQLAQFELLATKFMHWRADKILELYNMYEAKYNKPSSGPTSGQLAREEWKKEQAAWEATKKEFWQKNAEMLDRLEQEPLQDNEGGIEMRPFTSSRSSLGDTEDIDHDDNDEDYEEDIDYDDNDEWSTDEESVSDIESLFNETDSESDDTEDETFVEQQQDSFQEKYTGNIKPTPYVEEEGVEMTVFSSNYKNEEEDENLTDVEQQQDNPQEKYTGNIKPTPYVEEEGIEMTVFSSNYKNVEEDENLTDIEEDDTDDDIEMVDFSFKSADSNKSKVDLGPNIDQTELTNITRTSYKNEEDENLTDIEEDDTDDDIEMADFSFKSTDSNKPKVDPGRNINQTEPTNIAGTSYDAKNKGLPDMGPLSLTSVSSTSTKKVIPVKVEERSLSQQQNHEKDQDETNEFQNRPE